MFYPKGFQKDLLEINLRSNYSPEERVGSVVCQVSLLWMPRYILELLSESLHAAACQPFFFLGGGSPGFLDQTGAVFSFFLPFWYVTTWFYRVKKLTSH